MKDVSKNKIDNILLDIKSLSNEELSSLVQGLPSGVLEMAYREQELKFRMEDVICQAENLGIEVDDEDVRSIAEEFINKQDCNVSENELFEDILSRYDKCSKEME